MLRLAILLLVAPWPVVAHAWSECGHNVVALVAYDLLSEEHQAALVTLIEAHPRYAEDFEPPAKANDELRYRVARTGYWPDVARELPAYNRPKWHYELGSTLTIGDVEPHERPGRLPRDAGLDTKELHCSQALMLCRRVMADPKRSMEDRAISMTWIAHLVGDSHQPAHAGSLYAENVFPNGDRGANEIKLHNGRNLHALWDGLLGRRFSENRVRREVAEISDNSQMMAEAAERAAKPKGLDPQTWLAESRNAATPALYANEILAPIRAASDGRMSELPTLRVSEEYLRIAGAVARIRVCQAGHRLAAVWAEGLAGIDADLRR